MAAVTENLLAAARTTGRLAADCARYLGRTALDPAARKNLIRVAFGSAVLLAGYVFGFPSGPAGPSDSAGSGGGGGGGKKVHVWEGEISAKKTYSGADGLAEWTAAYHVRLREDCFGVEAAGYCNLDPLELKYAVEANEVLDKHHYGVYSSGAGAPVESHHRNVIGKASGILRLGENAPDAFNFWSNLHGGVYKEERAPVPPTTDLPHDSEAERYWLSCLGGVPEVTGQPAYWIGINLLSGYGSQDLRAYYDESPEVLNPLLRGIERSGPDLDSGNLASRSDHARPVLEFWLCGRLESPDDDEMSGEHAFSSTHGYSPATVLFNPDIPIDPAQINIAWKLERKRVELEEAEEPEDEPGETGQPGLAPADLALKAESAPDEATRGEQIRYQFEIENQGPADAQGVLLTISLGSAEWIGADASQGECTGGGDTVSCRLGELEEGGTADVTLRLMPLVAGMLSSAANVSSASPDPDMSNNLQDLAVRIQPQE